MYIIHQKGKPQKDGYLSDDKSCLDDDQAFVKLPKSLNGVTASQFAEYLDQDAENENHHSMVGVHDEVYRLVKKHSSEAVATKVMRALYERGGLHA